MTSKSKLRNGAMKGEDAPEFGGAENAATAVKTDGAIYLVDNKPHQFCACDNKNSHCPKGNHRSMYTAGFSQCLLPIQDVLFSAVAPAGPSLQEGYLRRGELLREAGDLLGRACEVTFRKCRFCQMKARIADELKEG